MGSEWEFTLTLLWKYLRLRLWWSASLSPYHFEGMEPKVSYLTLHSSGSVEAQRAVRLALRLRGSGGIYFEFRAINSHLFDCVHGNLHRGIDVSGCRRAAKAIECGKGEACWAGATDIR